MPFRKAVIDRRKKGSRLGRPPAVEVKLREAGGGPKFPGERTLAAGPVERLLELLLGHRRGVGSCLPIG